LSNKKISFKLVSQKLDVDKFRNGDIIPEARTNEEWILAEKKWKTNMVLL